MSEISPHICKSPIIAVLSMGKRTGVRCHSMRSAAFTSNESYLCSGYDLAKKVPILGITYTSGTEVTFEYFTGEGTDKIRYQCVGH